MYYILVHLWKCERCLNLIYLTRPVIASASLDRLCVFVSVCVCLSCSFSVLAVVLTLISVCSFHFNLLRYFVNSKFSICYILLSVFNFRRRLDVQAQFSCIPISFVTDIILWHVRWNCAKWLYFVTIVDVTVEIFIFYKNTDYCTFVYMFTCK